VAAITGHAIGAGCILSLCCDHRFISQGRKLMGLIEIRNGLPAPYPADRILRELVGVGKARAILDMGEFYEPSRSLELGLVDAVLPPEELLPAAVAKASSLAARPQEAFAMIKENRTRAVAEEIEERLPGKEVLFMECWYSEGTQALLREAARSFRKPERP